MLICAVFTSVYASPTFITTLHGRKKQGNKCTGVASNTCTEQLEEVCETVLEEESRLECTEQIINDGDSEVCETQLVEDCHITHTVVYEDKCTTVNKLQCVPVVCVSVPTTTCEKVGTDKPKTFCGVVEGEKTCVKGPKKVKRCQIVAFHVPKETCNWYHHNIVRIRLCASFSVILLL